MLIHDCLQYAARQPQKPCLVHGKRQLNYKQFAEKVNFLAHRLASKMQKNERVLVKLADPLDQLLYFFAVIQAGGSCILIDKAVSEEFCAELLAGHKITTYINEHFQLPEEAKEKLPDVRPEDVFLGALSSGSTGKPKVIWRDHASWLKAFVAQSQVFNIKSQDTIYLAGSLAYTANLNACLHMLSLGGTAVIASNNKPRTWLREMAAYQVTVIFMVPAHYRILLRATDRILPWVRSVVSGGAKMDLITARQLRRVFPHAGIYEYYGASELGYVTYMTLDDFEKRPQAVGKPFPGVTVTIEDGEIWVESPYLAPAYRPRASVGDLGKLDEAGFLYILGRKQGVINSGGIKVIPEQVAAVLNQCPGIEQAVVAGLADAIKGERVCAWVVKSNPALKAADVLAYCRTRLQRAHCPQKIIFVEEIPLNSNGKVDWPRLRKAYRLPVRQE